jgi:hypothetical protein
MPAADRRPARSDQMRCTKRTWTLKRFTSMRRVVDTAAFKIRPVLGSAG